MCCVARAVRFFRFSLFFFLVSLFPVSVFSARTKWPPLAAPKLPNLRSPAARFSFFLQFLFKWPNCCDCVCVCVSVRVCVCQGSPAKDRLLTATPTRMSCTTCNYPSMSAKVSTHLTLSLCISIINSQSQLQFDSRIIDNIIALAPASCPSPPEEPLPAESTLN